MKGSVAKVSIPFNRILVGKDCFILENEEGKFTLTTGISEYYILVNLAEEVKNNGTMIVEIRKIEGRAVLLPVAILNDDKATWITLTEDENTHTPMLEDYSLLAPFVTTAGEEYLNVIEDYYKDLYQWLVDEIQQDTSVIFKGLFGKLQNPYSETFPDKGDNLIAQASEDEIKAVNSIIKRMLEKISHAATEQIISYESRYADHYKIAWLYLLAVSRNSSPVVQEFMDYIYHNNNELLYARELDDYNPEKEKYWFNYLTQYAKSRGVLPDLLQRVEKYFLLRHKNGYWNYCHFYIALYAKLSLQQLTPPEFYDRFYRYVESNFMFLETIFKGILSDNHMKNNQILLDSRWRNTFNNWTESWEFDKAITVFEQIKDLFPLEIPREAKLFFTCYPR